eukprot:CAMPEP_0174272686 /NCGR_PEP_ID=MMETSP0439-20130205/52156_1 /TAXON_ID=0 /ORGANISM="Stereomyxa ramosa, Strain Chinc5" /LENGTH=299 /DNA_ID=CAMNT_0015363427 /DNA_START=20 /DNA_END=919 /DNA_ORIENTATION=+
MKVFSKKKKADLDVACPPGLSADELDDLVTTFRKYGNKKGKKISLPKFKKLFAKLHEKYPDQENFKPELIGVCFKFFDTDSDGFLDIDEFVVGVSTVRTGDLRARAEVAFKSIDLDNNGCISRDELAAHVAKITHLASNLIKKESKEEGLSFFLRKGLSITLSAMKIEMEKSLVDEVFATADADNDGQITMKEWIAAVEKGSPEVLGFLYPSESVEFGVSEVKKRLDKTGVMYSRESAKRTMNKIREAVDELDEEDLEHEDKAVLHVVKSVIGKPDPEIKSQAGDVDHGEFSASSDSDS